MIIIDFVGKQYFREGEKILIGRMVENVNLIGENKINNALFIFSKVQYEYAIVSAFLRYVYVRAMLPYNVERKNNMLIVYNANHNELFRIGDISDRFDLNELHHIMEN